MIRSEIVLTMPGRPAPKGSMKCVGQGGMHQLVESNKRSKAWRKLVADTARAHIKQRAEQYQPLGIEVTFTMDRPASHLGTGRNDGVPKPSAPAYPTKRPTGPQSGGDVDKLLRLVLDALEDAGVLRDDAQVIEVVGRKAYEKSTAVPDALLYPGIRIRIYPYEGI